MDYVWNLFRFCCAFGQCQDHSPFPEIELSVTTERDFERGKEERRGEEKSLMMALRWLLLLLIIESSRAIRHEAVMNSLGEGESGGMSITAVNGGEARQYDSQRHKQG
jgi:hypothetical protein